MDRLPSIYIAPLQINKDVLPEHKGQSAKSVTMAADYPPKQTGQMTPPPTPSYSEASFEQATEFQTYLRAFYPYHPSFDEDSSTVTLPLNTGDIILVHSIHTNGWADGTLLTSGARGWLPTNYCEPYDAEPIQTLMKALTVFWDLVKGSSIGGLEVFRNAHYVRGLVAGVRCLLDQTNCLNRESPLIQSHAALRRNRKALLSNLNNFVKITKGIESLLMNTSSNLDVELDLDEMVMKVFKTVMRAVKFLDIWEDHIQSLTEFVSTTEAVHMQVPPTPPADHTAFELADNKLETRSATGSHTAQANGEIVGDHSEQAKVRPRYSRASQTFIRPGSSNSCKPLYAQPSKNANRESVSHRVSCHLHSGSGNLASEKLSGLHNSFLTCLGYFIGLHIQSRSSAEIVLTTKQAVNSCRDMLKVVGAIWDRDWRRSTPLQEARDSMHTKITDLAEAALDILRPLRSGEGDEIVMPSGDKPLVEAATACVRVAGLCIAESRAVIDRIGDFDFEPLGLGISDLDKVFNPASVSCNDVGSEQYDLSKEKCHKLSELSTNPTSHIGHLPIASALSAIEPSPELSSTALEGMKEAEMHRLKYEIRTSQEVLLPPLPSLTSSFSSEEEQCSPQESSTETTNDHQGFDSDRERSNSVGFSSAGESSTYIGSMPDSENSAGSTRATSPDTTLDQSLEMSSYCNISSSSQITLFNDTEEEEAKVLERTFAHELIYNKEGQITGGTLPALIERLTTHDSTPDATFVSTFYLTFRLFATPIAIAQALIDRFQYVGESPKVAGPVRLRVYNVFKGWLESHWRNDCDNPALELIVAFANQQLQTVLPTAGTRLSTLASKVINANGPLVPRLISSMGKTNTSIALYVSPDSPLPAPLITKSQLVALQKWKSGMGSISILDFDPLELARQFTIKESQIFCSILPEELLATEWMKKSGSMAVNVRAMSRLSTDLTNLVADCILQLEDPKKRAIIIKQWVKIANKFLELANYDSLMAIICALDSSTILRLKRTWELVSYRTKSTLEHLKSVVDISRNYTILRQRLQHQVPPCLPFVGTYLTDLTFVDVGNQTTRQLHGEGTEDSKSVINFDKHMKTAKIISELQRFQIPYRFAEIPELQTWMQDQLVRVRTSDECNMANHYRRSLILEPREQAQCKQPSSAEFPSSTLPSRDKFEIFSLSWSHHSKEKLTPTTSSTSVP